MALAAVWLAAASATAMTAGLLRWPTLHWAIARDWMSASPASRELIAERFAAANFVLGNIIGEFAGELFLNGFFLTASIVLATGRSGRGWLMFAGGAASGLGWTAMFRNITPFVAPLAALNNLVLPLWMSALGVVLATTAVPQASLHPFARYKCWPFLKRIK